MSGAWKTVRVFISSTFRDMHAERDHLVKVVFPKLRQWCQERRLHLVDIDLRWGVTETEANNGKAIDICLKEIDGSRPFFVCILGERYGFVPDRLPPEELYRFRELQAVTHRSITHLEILHAVEQPLERLKPPPSGDICSHAFFYFRKPQCLPVPETLAGRLSDQELVEYRTAFFEPLPQPGELDRREQLGQLKRDIRARFRSQECVFEYDATFDPLAANPEDNDLKGRFTELEAFGDRIDSDLTRAIEAQFARHIHGASRPVDPLAEERAFHEAFIENRTQVHVPRLEIERHLTQYTSDKDTRPLVLCGPPGTGKSAILAHWINENVDLQTRLAKWDGQTLVIARFIGASSLSTSLPRLLGGIAQELVQHFQLQEEVEAGGPGDMKTKRTHVMELPQDPALVQAKWPKVLDAAAAKGPVLLVLDAVNQLDRSADPLRCYWLPHNLPKGVQLIVSVLDHGESATLTPHQSDWLAVLRRRDIREVPVPVLIEAEQVEIIRRLPSVFCKTLDPELVKVLVRNWATTNPLFLIVALEELRVFGGFKTLAHKIAQLPQLSAEDGPAKGINNALNELFGQVLDRLDREARIENLVPTMFRLLASAKEGLSEREMQEVLAHVLPGVDANRRTGAMQVILRQVRSYLMPKGALFDFYHRSFWKAVRVKYLRTDEMRSATHAQLAAYFNGQDYFMESLEDQRARAKHLPPTPRPANVRKVVELPWQLLEVAKLSGKNDPKSPHWDAVADLFTDLHFLEAKAEAQA